MGMYATSTETGKDLGIEDAASIKVAFTGNPDDRPYCIFHEILVIEQRREKDGIIDHVDACFQKCFARGSIPIAEARLDLGHEHPGCHVVAGLGELSQQGESDVGVEQTGVVAVLGPSLQVAGVGEDFLGGGRVLADTGAFEDVSVVLHTGGEIVDAADTLVVRAGFVDACDDEGAVEEGLAVDEDAGAAGLLVVRDFDEAVDVDREGGADWLHRPCPGTERTDRA